MINPFEDIRWHPAVPEIRRNGIILFIGLEILACILFFASGRTGFSWIPAALGPVLFLLSLFPRTGRWVYVGVYCLAASVGIVLSNVLLMLFFFLFLTPVAWILRVRKVKPVTGKKDSGAVSNWQEYSSPEDPTRYFKQY